MSMFPNSETRVVKLDYATDNRATFNFFNAVYAWMAVGLAVTATVAWFVSQSPKLMSMMFSSPYSVVAFMLAAWGIAYGVQAAALRISAVAAMGLFLVYATLVGGMVSYIFIIYPVSTIASAFVMTAGVFAVMSIYGFVTKRDLTGIGSILVMCAFGLIAASIVNVFMASNAFSWFLTYGILAVFIGLTAYETQQLKHMAIATANDSSLAARYAIIGSLVLYISFINMFLQILRILGSRR